MLKIRYFKNTKASILLFAALLTTFSFISMTKQCFSSAMAFIVEEGLMTKSQTGTIVAVFYLVYGFLQVVGGLLVDKWKPEYFVTFGFLGAGLCNLAVYFNQSYIFVLVMWVLNACSQFAVWPAVFKMISSMLKDSHRTNALFWITFANPLGTVANYAVAALIPYWELNLLISAVGLLVLAVLWEITFRCLRPQLIEEEIEPPARPIHTHYHEDQEHPHILPLLFSSGVAFLLIVVLVRSIFDNGLKTLVSTMINESYDNVTPALATALTIIILICGTVGPILSRRLYPHYLKDEVAAMILLFVLTLPFAALLLLLGKVHYVWIVVFLCMIVLFMSAASLFTSFISARFNKWGKSGTLAGAFNALTSLGIVVSNFVFTRVAERFNWTVTIEVWLAMLVGSILLLIVIARMWKRFLKNQYYH